MKKLASILATALLSLAVPATAIAAAEGSAKTPWERGETRTRGALTTRPPAELPRELRRTESTAAEAEIKAVPRGADKRRHSSLERRVIEAARRAATERVEGPGMRNYFRVGFRQGLIDAFEDPRVGRADLRLGLRDGGLDREARRLGRVLGTDAAVEIAAHDAAAAVETQFRDLAFEPIFQPLADAPAWAAPAIAFDDPVLEDLFVEFPFGSFAPLRSEFELYLTDWGWTAAKLRRSSRYADVYDARWDDAGLAFGDWVTRPKQARWFRGLSEIERRELKNLFFAVFDRHLDRLASTRLDHAWNVGLERGWDYGCFIREELEYRTGYAQGFRREAALLAKAVFRSTYPREFRSAYELAFDRWSRRAVPEIGTVTLLDGNDDGVFEPGEKLLVDIELINFGGTEGAFRTSVNGEVLAEIDSVSTVLPRRSSVVHRGLLEATIDAAVRPRTRTRLELRVGDAVRDVRLEVRRPLEWVASSLRTRRDNLAGRVEVEIELRNLSRRALNPSAAVSTAEQSRSVGPFPVRALDRSTVLFEIDALSPLDLIAGDVTLDLYLDAEGVEQDRMSAALAGTATDLASRDLARLVRRMAVTGASAADLARVRDLVLARLRVDWRAAVRGRGNPYKRDYRAGSEQTALGEIVRLAASIPRTDRRELFDGLSRDVLLLAEDLPGPHPLLRKYVRRLARRLP